MAVAHPLSHQPSLLTLFLSCFSLFHPETLAGQAHQVAAVALLPGLDPAGGHLPQLLKASWPEFKFR